MTSSTRPTLTRPLAELTDVRQKRVTVMGLGRFGGQIAVARFLCAQQASVLVTDASPAEKLRPSIDELAGLPIAYRLGEHRTEDFTSADLIVASPAVPPHNPYLSAARAAGVPVVTEIELTLERLHRQNPRQIVLGVTGTKGKSTTTALLGRMLSAVRPTRIGGNIGRPLLNELATLAPDELVLLELSSFMLHYLGQRAFRPHIAVVTPITADHLDWHGGVDAYIDAKRQIVRHQTGEDHAVLCGASGTALSFGGDTAARVHVFRQPAEADALPMRLPGAHNQLNAAGALLAASLLGVTREQASAAVADFGGLPHRLELVHESDGVRYYNDSIATVPEAAVAALRAFPSGTVLQIVGGSGKGLDMTPLVAALKAHARAVLCIGTLGPELADAVGPAAELCHTLDRAVARARLLARPGDTVLLSPGCASYDQFTHFEARGEAFRQLARAPAPPADGVPL